jgi:hypothetical protein
MFNNKEFLTSGIIYKKRSPGVSYQELSNLMETHPDRQQMALLRESRVNGMLTVDFLQREQQPGSLRFAYIDSSWINVSGVDAAKYEHNPGLQQLFVNAYRATPQKVLDKLVEQLKILKISPSDFVMPSPDIASSFYTYKSCQPTAPDIFAPPVEAPPQLSERSPQAVKVDADEIARQAESARNEAIATIINKVIDGAIKGLPAYSEFNLPVLVGIRAKGKLGSTQEEDLRKLLQNQIEINHLFTSGSLPQDHTALLIYNLSAMLQSYMKHQPRTGLFSEPDRIVFDKRKKEELIIGGVNEIIQSVAAMAMPLISTAPTMQAQPDASVYPDPGLPASAVYSQLGHG